MNDEPKAIPTPAEKAQELAAYEARLAREAKASARRDSLVNPRRR